MPLSFAYYGNKKLAPPVYTTEVVIVNKRTFGFVLSLVILLGSGLLIKPQAVYACSCAAPLSAEKQVKDELDRKSAIFAGKVVKITQPQQNIIISSADLVKVTFEVSKVWKGELGRQAVVYTAMSSASCGVENFQVGTKYIVSAYKDSKPLETTICNLTKPLASAGAELAVLGEGYAPTNQAQEKGNSSPMSLIISAATVLIVGTIVLLFIRRRNLNI
jgi:cobalamin biosynthesis Mg chelatase CobN